jgi:hypothetical protein
MIIGMTGATGELGRQPVRYESVSEEEHTAALRAAGLLFDDSHSLARPICRPTTPLRSAVAEALRGRAAAT